MTLSFEALQNASSLPEAQAAFGDFLGLEAPVPAGALRHAFADQYYRHNLILNRGRPEMLRRLLRHPRNAEFEQGEDEAAQVGSTAAASSARSTTDLAAKGVKSLYAWAKTGFALLDQEAFDARFSACERCDLLSAPPDKWVYHLTSSKRSDPRVCGACGCTAARKARLASESCPMPDPANPGLTRWGEPIRPAS